MLNPETEAAVRSIIRDEMQRQHPLSGFKEGRERLVGGCDFPSLALDLHARFAA
jgi:hypothetical protein